MKNLGGPALLLILGGIALCQTALAQDEKPVDLSGVWAREDGGVLRLTQDGQTVKMVHLEVTPVVHKDFGFNPGDEHVMGTLEGRTLRGKMHVRLPVSWKTICPDQWDHWSGIEVSLSQDGNTLTGRWEQTFFSRDKCQLTHTVWLPREYTRVREVASSDPGTLNAIAVGKPLAVASFELILDASGSMWGTVGGRPKIEIAKETMRQVIEKLPDDVYAALRVYGHRVASGRPGACQDSELVFPLAKIDKSRFIERIRGLKALGTTPIAYSLSQVATDIGGIPGEKMVILVTDGKEECGGSPSRAVSGLIGKGLNVQVNIVGFALEEEAAKSEMRRVAELSGGRFFDAGNAAALRDSIEQALAVPYDVLNSAGRKVAGGRVGRGGIQVPEGTYTVVVNITGNPVTIRGVRIVPNKPTTVELEQQGQQISTRVRTP
jgi:hypothetical protein